MIPLHSEEVDRGLAGLAEPRRNTGQRDIVTRGLATLSESGIVPAVEYLKSNGVRPQVIERVLLEPARRRAPV